MSVMEYVTELVNDTGILPVTARLDYLSREAPSAAVLQLPGAVRAKTYIDNTGTVETPFAIDVRYAEKDSEIAADIMRLLVELEAISEHTEPVNEVYGESTPTIIDRDGKGNVIWRATGVVRWKRGATDAVVS